MREREEARGKTEVLTMREDSSRHGVRCADTKRIRKRRAVPIAPDRCRRKGLNVADGQVSLLIKRKPGTEDVPLPKYMSEHAAGMDLCAAVEETMKIEPGAIALVPTGIYMALPPGYEAQVRPRSGLALKHGVTVLNAPGTVDSDYRNEVGVILANLGAEPFTVQRGMRVAQMIIARAIQAEMVEVDELSETERGLGGFGSTGMK